MAKQTQVLNRFDGGINDQFSQQDIPDNALVRADNVMVDNPGRIRLTGSQQDAIEDNIPGTTTPGYGMFTFQSDFDNSIPNVEKSPNSTNRKVTGLNFLPYSGFMIENPISPQLTASVLNIGTHTGHISLYDSADTSTAGRWVLQKVNGNNDSNDPALHSEDGWFYQQRADDYDVRKGTLIGNTQGYGVGQKVAYAHEVLEKGKCYRVEYLMGFVGDSTAKMWCHGGVNLFTGKADGPNRKEAGYYTEYVETTAISNGNIGIRLNKGSNNAYLEYFSITEVPAMRDTSYIAFQNENVTYLRDTTNNIWRTSSHGVINMDAANSDVALHKSADTEPIFYIADGILRVCDANLSNANTISKWYGILNRTFFNNTNGNAIWRTWHSGDQKLYKPTSTSHVSNFETKIIFTLGSKTVTVHSTSDYIGESNIKVGQYVNGIPILPNTVITAVSPSSDAVTSFEISKPSMASTPGTTNYFDMYFSEKRDYHPGKADVDYHAGTSSVYPDFDSPASDGIKFHYSLDFSDSSTDGSWDSASYKFYISYLYDKSKQESGLHYMATASTGSANRGLACAVTLAYFTEEDTSGGGYVAYLFNERVTGARIYYTDSEDADGLYYQLLEVDFEKGVRKYDELSYTSWATGGTGITKDFIVECPDTSVSDTTTLANSFHFLHPPKVLTYQTLNGYDSDEETIFKYKTAVVTNRRCYIGNVARLDTSTHANHVTEKFNDRIIKSPVNKFDTFPEGNFLDVTINDGDEIVRLETFADRLLQFKRKKMFIINISQDIEFLESEHSFMGVDHHSAVTKTEIGIIWTNSRGCYVYDGKQIKNLTDNKINSNTWKEFLNISGMVGYIPDKKQIVVVKDPGLSDGSCYIYDFSTTSWTYGSGLLSFVMKTNMTNDKFGNLIWGEYVNEGSSAVVADIGYDYTGTIQDAQIGIAPTVSLSFQCPESYWFVEWGEGVEG